MLIENPGPFIRSGVYDHRGRFCCSDVVSKASVLRGAEVESCRTGCSSRRATNCVEFPHRRSALQVAETADREGFGAIGKRGARKSEVLGLATGEALNK
jgi:hypothetical protein